MDGDDEYGDDDDDDDDDNERWRRCSLADDKFLDLAQLAPSKSTSARNELYRIQVGESIDRCKSMLQRRILCASLMYVRLSLIR